MNIKFNLHHLLIIIILLCIMYFAYHFYYEKKTQENFENNDYQGLSAYYKDTVNSNDIQNYLLPRWSTKKLQDSTEDSSTVLKKYSDPWTGTYTNFTLDNTTPLSTDTFCVIRKLGDKLLFTLGPRSMQNSNLTTDSSTAMGNDITDDINPYYTIQGTAKIESSSSTMGNAIIKSVSTTNNSGLSYLPAVDDLIKLSVTTTGTTKSHILKIINNNQDKYIFNNQVSSTVNNGTNTVTQSSNYFNYDKEFIQPFYTMNTTGANSTQFKDLNCAPGMKLCKFSVSGTDYYACADSDNIDGDNCNFLSTDVSGTGAVGTYDSSKVCVLGTTSASSTSDVQTTYNDSSGNVQNVNVSPCNPNYNINIGGYDFMLNKITTDNKLNSCNFIKDMVKTNNCLIMYFYDKKNFSNLSFQYWGESSNESRLLTIKNKLNTAFSNLDRSTTFRTFIDSLSLSTGTLDKTVYTTPSINWEINPDMGNLSCYFSICSKPVNTKPSYYIQSQTNGSVNMTLLNGGFDKYFTLLNEKTGNANGTNINYFAGDLRASNGLYLSPGNSSITELSPVTGTNERVCTLVSSVPSGKWVIISYPSSVTNPFA